MTPVRLLTYTSDPPSWTAKRLFLVLLCHIACWFGNLDSPTKRLAQAPVIDRENGTAGGNGRIQALGIVLDSDVPPSVVPRRSWPKRRHRFAGSPDDGMALATTRTLYLSACGAPRPLRATSARQERQRSYGVRRQHGASLVMQRDRISLPTSNRARDLGR